MEATDCAAGKKRSASFEDRDHNKHIDKHAKIGLEQSTTSYLIGKTTRLLTSTGSSSIHLPSPEGFSLQGTLAELAWGRKEN
jgi:hypothetical protein